jgi:transposase-like protein
MDGCMLPRMIVTNKELALMNAIKNIFPNASNLLCRWHISRNILANCKKFFEIKDRWEAFITSWNILIISPTEDDYKQLLTACNRDFCSYPQALDYVNKFWLSKHKEQFVAA